jgi:hypothetical protein
MIRERPLALTLAGGLMVLAALGYGALVVFAVASGGLYLSALGGNTRVGLPAIIVGYGPLVPLAGFIAWRLLRVRFDRAVSIAFSLWFGIAALDLIVLGSWEPAIQVALTAIVALALVETCRKQLTGGGPVP